ncbi:Cytochrome P450 isoform 2 [Hibiscus syriacus]|uniref:Cytochrome P450 isoform 2 n=1 Tax=Hibiscus syriacus TaxID=106335 RepID=A0A6A3AZ49_HIBSY|nr:cytochrome P450 714C2-like [Hibiscus syriacus]KAE8709970.1 Cytochrome P450 isoform 2 [Hibiscus syriacus]
MEPLLINVLLTILLLVSFSFLASLFNALVLEPKRLRSKLEKEGIKGPPHSFLLGNMWDLLSLKFKNSKRPQQGQQILTHNCAAFVFPFLVKWRNQYGPSFVFSLGNLQILHMNHPNALKELSTCTSFELGRPTHHHYDAMLGEGIIASSGRVWARQRKILAPELFVDKVKGMRKLMEESAFMVANALNEKIEKGGGVAELKIDDYTRSFAGDVLLKACFGTNYAQGKEIFLKLRDLQDVLAPVLLLQWIPGMRYLPTKSNRRIWRLEKEIKALILKVVKEREEAKSNPEKDLLQIIVESAERSDLGQQTDSFIVDNCKNIYFAGYETTSVSAAWTLMLLALYPEWQDKVRAEILENCGGLLPDADTLRRMKTLAMVINESLRLYSPAAIVPREALGDVKFGGINVPKGVGVFVSLITLHLDPDLWGPDADKFIPERFADGISGACKVPYAYMPFGAGPHTCIGQHFAMMELKIFLVHMLSNFAFTLSPKYIHSPFMNLVVEPEFGIDLLVTRL